MGLRINTNVEALFVRNQLARADRRRSTALNRISTGRRINSARDDSSGLAIANMFHTRMSSLQVANQNSVEAQSMLRVADGAYSKIENILARMKDLATQAASGQLSDSDRAKLNDEFESVGCEIDRIAKSTRYGNISLIGSGGATTTFQVGATTDAADRLGVTFDSATVATLGLGGTLTINSLSTSGSQPSSYPGTGWVEYANGSKWTGTVTGDWENVSGQLYSWPGSDITADQGSGTTTWVGAGTSTAPSGNSGWSDFSLSGATWTPPPNILTQANAQSVMSVLDTALSSVNGFMSNIGSCQNRLEYTMENLQTVIQNYQSSESTIRDADISVEVTELARAQIIASSSMTMLAHANQTPELILQLLQ